MANPSVKNGHIDIASELAERFAHASLSGQEWRIIWVVLRKTWGWKDGDRKKDFDYISLSQFEEGTGMKHTNVVETLRKLVVKRLLLRKGNGYGMNQNYDEWVVVKRLPPLNKPQVVVKMHAPSSQTTTGSSSQLTTKSSSQTTTNNRYIDKKDNIQKKEPENLSDDELQERFMKTIEEHEWISPDYADKTWNQGMLLRGANRKEFLRKVFVMSLLAKRLNTQGKAKIIFHEIAGMVNDRGAMEKQLTGAEIKSRKEFAEEEMGKKYIDAELAPKLPW